MSGSLSNYAFISYVRENRAEVDRLRDDLRRHGVDVWIDRDQIVPGRRWRLAIRDAIRQGASFLACFSEEYIKRNRTYMNEELTLAIDELRQHAFDRTWFIPIRLAPVPIPARPLGGGEVLGDLHCVDLFENWEDGVRAIVDAISPEITAANRQILRRVEEAVVGGFDEKCYFLLELISEQAVPASAVVEAFAGGLVHAGRGCLNTKIVALFCERYGAEFNARQILRVFELASDKEATGLLVVGSLYDYHWCQVRQLQRPDILSGLHEVAFYCALRERYPGVSLDEILIGDVFKRAPTRGGDPSWLHENVHYPENDIAFNGLSIDRQRYLDARRRGVETYAFMKAIHRLQSS
jgi:TIR domain